MKAMVFDDDPVVCTLLCRLLTRRGYEATSFSDPVFCPCPVIADASCSRPVDQPCAYIIVSDIQMPEIDGLDFVESQLKKGCKCKHIALISGAWSEENVTRAKQLPVKTIAKPFRADEINAWLDEVEKSLIPAAPATCA